MRVHWVHEVGEDWEEIRSELDRAFQLSRQAAQQEESLVYVVRTDDLLGRRGAGNAMVATGLLSAARTAALEGKSKGWTANVIAFDDDPSAVDRWIDHLARSPETTGELIRIGSGHIGKALP